MPIDREKRDAATEALVGFLRQQTDFEANETVFKQLQKEIVDAGIKSPGKDFFLEKMLDTWFKSKNRFKPLTEEQWLEMCRHLAFLRTDLDLNSSTEFNNQVHRSHAIVLARWHVIILVAFIGVAYLTHWWIWLVAFLISWTYFQIFELNISKLRKAHNNQISLSLEYFPFANEAEWLAHRHLLEEYHIPPFDADAFADPTPQKQQYGIFEYTLICVAFLFFCILVTFALFCFLCIFPWALLKTAFTSTKHSSDLTVES